MFQKLISLTPVAIAHEIEHILKNMPWDLTQRFNASPELKENIVQAVLVQFTSNKTLNPQSLSSRSDYKAGATYPYIQQEQLQLLVRHTLLLTLDGLERDAAATLNPVSARF